MEIVLVPSGSTSKLVQSNGSTSNIEVKANGATAKKDSTSAKKDSTSTKNITTSTVSTKHETTVTNEDMVSVKAFVQNIEGSSQNMESSNKKVSKTGPVEVVNTFVDDSDDDVMAAGTTLPKPATAGKARPHIKDKSQSVEEIIDDLGMSVHVHTYVQSTTGLLCFNVIL